MDRATQLELNAINQRFYAAIAPEWSDKRKHPWPGWERVLAALGPAAVSGSGRALDLGCGDGRLAAFLQQRAPRLDYLGVDASAALLARACARADGPGPRRFVHADFFTTPLDQLVDPGPFALICLFGVLHHVPARVRREQLVRELGRRLGPRSVLALTLWRLDEDPRFATRRVAFEDYNRTAQKPLALEQLEPGDTLIRWGDRDALAPPRFCHFPDAAETDALIGASGLQVLRRFRADGHGDRMNEYVLLTQPPT